MEGYLMSGALDTHPVGHSSVQSGPGNTHHEQTDKVNGDTELSRPGTPDALYQRSHSEAVPAAAPHHVDLRKACSAPELRSAGTVANLGNKMSKQPQEEAGLPLPQPQNVNIQAGLSSPNSNDAEETPAVMNPLSPSKKGAPPAEDFSWGWTYTPPWDHKIFETRLPFGVHVYIKSNGALELSYRRFGRTWSDVWGSPSESFLDEIVRTFEELKATADLLKDALDDINFGAGFSTAVYFTREGGKFDFTGESIGLRDYMLVVENVNSHFVHAIVDEDKTFLGPLIHHISRRCPRLASRLSERLSAFNKAWRRGKWSRRAVKNEHWDAVCVRQQDIERSDLHTFLTFLMETQRLGDGFKSEPHCRLSLAKSDEGECSGPELLVLIDSPYPVAHPFESSFPVDHQARGARMPICLYDTGEEHLSFFEGLSELLRRSLFPYHDYYYMTSGDRDTGLTSHSTMQWVVIRYAWETHLNHLKDEVESAERIGLEAPSVRSLHRLNIKRKHVQQAAKEIVNCLKVLEAASDRERFDRTNELFYQSFRALEGKAAALKQDINDATTLLIGAISVMDAGDSRIQTRRSTALTALAAMYLPLSLATGVFGMNIWEINQGSPRWWAAVSLGLGLLVISIPFLAWVFVDRGGPTQTGYHSRLSIGYDTSRLEGGLGASSDASRLGHMEKYS